MRMPQGLELSEESKAHAEEVVNQAMEELGCTREEAEQMFWVCVYKRLAEMFSEMIDSYFFYGSGVPVDLGVPQIDPSDIDYHHQLPSNKHPWERDGIANLE